MDAPQIKQRLASLTTKQKGAAAAGLGAVLLSVACCCPIGGWLIYDFGAKREQERIEAKKKKDFEDLQAAVGKAFFPGNGKVDAKPIAHHDAAEVIDLAGVKFQLLGGEVSEIKYKRRDFRLNEIEALTREKYFQIRFRVTNATESKIIKVTPWYGTSSARLRDEFGNNYRCFDPSSDQHSAFPYVPRLDPSKSVESLVAFEIPLEKSKEFILELPAAYIDRPDDAIAYKLPRSFFEKK